MDSRRTKNNLRGVCSVGMRWSYSLHVDPGTAPSLRIETPDGAEGMEFVLDFHPDERGTLRFNVHYAGLLMGRVLSYARFLRALYPTGEVRWEQFAADGCRAVR